MDDAASSGARVSLPQLGDEGNVLLAAKGHH
jgi:hypothetical protein